MSENMSPDYATWAQDIIAEKALENIPAPEEEVIFPDMVEDSTLQGRPLFTAKHMNAICDVLDEEARQMAMRKVILTESEWGYDDYLLALSNFQGRAHQWNVLANMLGHMFRNANANFDWSEFKRRASYETVNDYYLWATKTIQKMRGN